MGSPPCGAGHVCTTWGFLRAQEGCATEWDIAAATHNSQSLLVESAPSACSLYLQPTLPTTQTSSRIRGPPEGELWVTCGGHRCQGPALLQFTSGHHWVTEALTGRLQGPRRYVRDSSPPVGPKVGSMSPVPEFIGSVHPERFWPCFQAFGSL